MSEPLPAILPPVVALAPAIDTRLMPAVIADAGGQTSWCYVIFFTSHIRTPA